MDRSLDSIGSCSLDVDAESSDISGSSCSLNFPTPLSVKDVTREFTANIKERCTVNLSQLQQTTAYIHPTTGEVRMVLTPPKVDQSAINVSARGAHCTTVNRAITKLDPTGACDKKPSYLNLACCVNGYSNLTTYDSKIRQDINKSREVSPIRPSTSSLQYCKKNNSLAVPVLIEMPNSLPFTKQPTTQGSKYGVNEANNNFKNGELSHLNGVEVGSNGSTSTSFIQQRVERLYGPGALAQVFYSPKKQGVSSGSTSYACRKHLEIESSPNSELARKFKELSPSKDYGEFQKKLNINCTQSASLRRAEINAAQVPGGVNNSDVDLPVFRLLTHEFRAQLPTVSPKRSMSRNSQEPSVILPIAKDAESNNSRANTDVVDHEAAPKEIIELVQNVGDSMVLKPSEPLQQKDGNYFLKQLKNEQARLLALAAVADKYTDALTNNPEISEDAFGLLRSASGKARLLVSQKMKQFEGLCHNNLNRSPEDAFPTTTDDLQGFWDMVNLQVVHIDNIFADIEELRTNDWKRIADPKVKSVATPKASKTTKTASTKTKSIPANANGSNSAAALKREVQRKQLLEMKRQRREAMAADKNKTTCNERNENLQDSVITAVEKSS